MVEKKTFYEVSGKLFPDYESARAYDELYQSVIFDMQAAESCKKIEDSLNCCFESFLLTCMLALPSEQEFIQNLLKSKDYSDIRHHKCYDVFWRHKEEYPILFYAYEYFCHIDFKTGIYNPQVSFIDIQ